MITIIDAIKNINPDAEVTVYGDDINTIVWNDGTPVISNEDILAKQTELQAEFDFAAERLDDLS